MFEKKYKDFTVVPGNDELFINKNDYKSISFKELISLYENDDFIPYQEYLRTKEWHLKRLEILDRDDFNCQKCGACDTVIIKSDNIEKFEWDVPNSFQWEDIEGVKRTSKIKKPERIPDKFYSLQIHHKKYIINKLPWNYDNEDLITLCNHCHKEVHETSNIQIYSENGSKISDCIPCRRCGGTGYFAEYKYVQGGICFKCRGKRFNIELIRKSRIGI